MATQSPQAAERIRLNQRIRRFYRYFNENNWKACFERVDPKLREGRVNFGPYAESLSSFFEKYGPIQIESIDLRLYASVQTNRHDDRPFAYGTVHWQDNQHKPHVLRERWVKSADEWYTRMVGLI
jgi:hypothetical protein